MTFGANGYRLHIDTLAPWAQSQHAQGLCESWVPRPRARSGPCLSRANSEVTATGAPTMVLHLCRVHATPYIGAINRQHAGQQNVTLPLRHVPLPQGLKWRPL